MGRGLYPYASKQLREQAEQAKKMRKALKQSEETNNNNESKLKTEEEKKTMPESKPKTEEVTIDLTVLPDYVLFIDLTNDDDDEKNPNEKPASQEFPETEG